MQYLIPQIYSEYHKSKIKYLIFILSTKVRSIALVNTNKPEKKVYNEFKRAFQLFLLYQIARNHTPHQWELRWKKGEKIPKHGRKKGLPLLVSHSLKILNILDGGNGNHLQVQVSEDILKMILMLKWKSYLKKFSYGLAFGIAG